MRIAGSCNGPADFLAKPLTQALLPENELAPSPTEGSSVVTFEAWHVLWAALRSPAKRLTFSGLNGDHH